MSIVFITVPGDERQMFANALHKKTNGKIELVIVQKPKPKLPFFKRIKRLYERVGLTRFPLEVWYALLLRLNKSKEILGYFRSYNTRGSEKYIPNMIEVDSVNSDEVYQTMKKISPKLLVIWGNAILDTRILQTAERAINLHMGHSPNYRGALANQNAILLQDYEHIGATIHYAIEKVDSGKILTVLSADRTLEPKEMFLDLNDRAISVFLDVAGRMSSGEELPTTSQDISNSRNLKLKQWLPSTRYVVFKKLLKMSKKNKK